jgi:DNA polymerase IV
MFVPAQPHELRYLFIDFNAFFASVEQHDDPSLRGRPVIVIPLPSEHSGAIAASYEAKALGISRGTSVAEARQLCPDIIVRAARHDRYVAVHGLLMAEIGKHIPVTQVCSIDECLCALDRTERGPDPARAKALAIKRGIARNVGASLKASIGIAASPLLAKLASELVKPDGLTVIDDAMLPAALADLPLRAIPGIGHGVETRLMRAGIHDFLGLWHLQPKQARTIWGSVEGERFYYGLHGYDIRRPEPAEKRMIGHSRVLSGSYRQPDGARIVARALILKAASRLRYYDLHAGAMHLSVKLASGDALGHDAVLRATQNSWRFLRELEEFWPRMIAAVRSREGPRAKLKLVSCYLHALQPQASEPDLFVPAEEDQRDAQHARLWRTIDDLNRRYGKQRVMLGSQAGLDLNYLGVKIAFSRVPEAAEFEC